MTEKEELEKLVKESNSFAEILRKQNKSVSGSSIKHLRSKLDEYGISYIFLNKRHGSIKYSLSELLVENRYCGSSLKKRLIKEGLKEDKCEVCGCSNEWNGLFLTLQLDHVNGNHLDNRIENLRVICPNCHSQTDTFGTKRFKKRNYCVDCRCEIHRGSTRCKHCSPKHSKTFKVNPEDKPTKLELFELIKTKSFTSIGEMYGVADNAIRKWCRKYNLPSTKKELRELDKAGLL